MFRLPVILVVATATCAGPPGTRRDEGGNEMVDGQGQRDWLESQGPAQRHEE